MGCLADGGDICCYDECFAAKFEIFKNGIFNPSGLLHSITRGKSVGQAEIAVVENSIRKCMKISESTQETGPGFCNIPQRVYTTTQCVFKENYKNCPEISPECQQLGNILQKCDRITTTIATTTKMTTTMLPITTVPRKIQNVTTTQPSNSKNVTTAAVPNAQNGTTVQVIKPQNVTTAANSQSGTTVQSVKPQNSTTPAAPGQSG